MWCIDTFRLGAFAIWTMSTLTFIAAIVLVVLHIQNEKAIQDLRRQVYGAYLWWRKDEQTSRIDTLFTLQQTLEQQISALEKKLRKEVK